MSNPKEEQGNKKAQMYLLPPEALRQCTAALEFGAFSRGYGAYNWRSQPIKLTTYISAVQRHLQAIAEGEANDADSGVSHFSHIMANMALLIDAQKFGALIHDLPLVEGSLKTSES